MSGTPSSSRRVRLRVLPVVLAALVLGPAAGAQVPPPAAPLRLHGLVEAVDFFNLMTPTGSSGQVTIIKLAPKGTLVHKGDVIVEFDRQEPLREALDKQAEWKQLEEDIRKKEAEMRLQAATDDTAAGGAENDIALARLEITKNDVLPRIDAEKNTLALQAAEAKLPSLRTSVALKRKAADAELEILKVKRDRAARVRDRAQQTADALLVRSPDRGAGGAARRMEGQRHGQAPRRATTSGRARRCSTSSVRARCRCA